MKGLNSYISFIEKELSLFNVPNSPHNLYDPIRYFLNLGGKRIRPILTLLGTELFNYSKEDAVSAALSVEVFHNFSLIHDDIMDQAPLRRNQATVHVKWNVNNAILSGDVMLVKAYELLSKQKKEHVPQLLMAFNQMAIEVCEGQQMDMDFELRNDVSITEYIEMIRLKTAVLLGCALKMGAIIANASITDVEYLDAFGQHIGIAFQIQDDILDLYADPLKFGKQVGGDVIANKKTLLNLKAHEIANASQIRELNALSIETDVTYKINRSKELFDSIGARQACEAVMSEHFEMAMCAFNKIAAASEQKQSLIDLVDFLMVRNQ